MTTNKELEKLFKDTQASNKSKLTTLDNQLKQLVGNISQLTGNVNQLMTLFREFKWRHKNK